jgi:hypothetical protein
VGQALSPANSVAARWQAKAPAPTSVNQAGPEGGHLAGVNRFCPLFQLVLAHIPEGCAQLEVLQHRLWPPNLKQGLRVALRLLCSRNGQRRPVVVGEVLRQENDLAAVCAESGML